jgi:thioredoxin
VARLGRFGIVALLAVAVVAVAAVRARERDRPAERGPNVVADVPAARLPRLVDLGAGKCIPCKAMAPILDQLRADYPGRLEVTFIDVWKFPEQAAPYGIQMIPTQVFFAADGRELARHQGFMSREEILAQWKALGVEL